jgi:uncharacterized membrane protein
MSAESSDSDPAATGGEVFAYAVIASLVAVMLYVLALGIGLQGPYVLPGVVAVAGVGASLAQALRRQAVSDLTALDVLRSLGFGAGGGLGIWVAQVLAGL